jgi:hypothetical protein
MRNLDQIKLNNCQLPLLVEQAREQLKEKPDCPFEAFVEIFKWLAIEPGRPETLLNRAIKVETIFKGYPSSLEKVKDPAELYQKAIYDTHQVFCEKSSSMDQMKEGLVRFVCAYEQFKRVYNDTFRAAAKQPRTEPSFYHCGFGLL